MLKHIRTVEGYELITISDAAKICGVTVRTVYNWIEDERLPIRANIAGKVKMIDRKEALTASASYQKTKPRGGKSTKDIKIAA